MFRTCVTAVLMLLVGLPNGICFCHYVQASPVDVEPSCCHAEEDVAPSEPAPPGDDGNDDDCSCKLRQVLSADVSPVEAPRDPSHVAIVNGAAFDSALSLHTFDRSLHSARTLDTPIPLILCALRI